MSGLTRRYARPDALAGLPPLRNAVIEASAGTGKTHTLEHLVVDLLLAHRIPIDQILVVTFTERASRELSARVRGLLESLLAGAWTEPAAAVPDERCWVVDEEARRLLGQALFAFDTANISTIHSFCQRVLTDHAFAHLRLFDQTQIAEGQAFSEAFLDAARRELSVDPGLSPWFAQWLARGNSIEKLLKLLTDCARAGGKVRPETDPEKLAAATALLPLETDLRDANAAVISPDAVVAQLFLPRIRERARERKRLAGEYDFQDMLDLVAESLEGPRGEELVQTLRARYRCALIDEFQDTDDVQWRIFRRIFFESGGTNPLYIIGDPKQAIYGFRGADVATYLAAREEVLRRGGTPLALAKSYRSTPALIEACNAIFDQSASPPFFTGGIAYRTPVTAARADFLAVGPGGQEASPIRLYCPTAKGKFPNAERLREILGDWIAREIRDLLGAPPSLLLREGRENVALKARDIFVLTRTEKEGYIVGEHLRAAGIPHVYFKQEGLFQRDEARHICDLLRAVEDPHDRSLRFRAWIGPFFGLTLRDLENAGGAGTAPLMERLLEWKVLADARQYGRLFARVVEESGIVRRELFFRESERELTNYLHIFEILLEEAGRTKGTLAELIRNLNAYIAKERFPEGLDANVQRLESEKEAVQIMTIHKAKGLESSVVFLFGGFTAGRGENKVRIYHEGATRFAYVGKNAAEPIEAAIEQESLEEDQRLLYVALTRARARLYLPYFASPAAQPKNFNGVCSQLNARLVRLLGGPMDVRLRRLFAIQEIACDDETHGTDASPAADLSRWRPPAKLLAQQDLSGKFREARERHKGFIVASYTALKAGAGYQAPEDALEDAADEPASAVSGPPASDELPGGRASGIFLHTVLEEVPLEALAAGAPFSRWRTDENVDRIFRQAMRLYGRDPRYLEHSQRLVHTALGASVRLPDGSRIEGLSRAAKSLREVEFLYPIPEKDHPRLSSKIAGAPGLERFRIERGFVRGFVDFVFVHEGLTYFLDWKSDSLPRWDADYLAAHVARNYRLQAKLYGLALVKMLGVHDRGGYEKRFGGFLYCFLRGMRAPGSGVEGIHAERPDWTKVAEWEDELLRPDFLPSAVESRG